MLLQIKGLIKRFGSLIAISDLDFEMTKGELTSVIGPNGAGKTTLFNVITGQLKADDGTILFKDVDLLGLHPHQISHLGIARSFQITNIFQGLSVFENVRLAVQSRTREATSLMARSTDMPEVNQKTEEILNRINLHDYRNHLANQLSHGDQRHLEIGMTLATEPELLMLDEPTSGMSPAETVETMKLIAEISQYLTVLLIEHDMDVVMGMSQRVAVMNFGRKIAEGTPDDIAGNPQVREVYLGDL
jgi:branched-chain amino acid transport system ATP-binding protein